ncbi:MAG: NifU N-terminal domain-containing protein [Planctomycetota bacterium]|jgi:hypothetical protein
MAQVTPQPTPNPLAYKFTLAGHRFERPLTLDAGSAGGTPFEGLFKLPGIVSVFATGDFVTVTKDAGADWGQLIDPARKHLEESF